MALYPPVLGSQAWAAGRRGVPGQQGCWGVLASHGSSSHSKKNYRYSSSSPRANLVNFHLRLSAELPKSCWAEQFWSLFVQRADLHWISGIQKSFARSSSSHGRQRQPTDSPRATDRSARRLLAWSSPTASHAEQMTIRKSRGGGWSTAPLRA